MPSPHDVLQIRPTAGRDEIRSAYRRLAKQWHPDRRPHDPGATRRLQALNAAYETLAPAAEEEAALWRATRDGETITLTTLALRHERPPRIWEVARRDIRQVALAPVRRSTDAIVLVRTSTSAHRIELPRPLASRLAELLIG